MQKFNYHSHTYRCGHSDQEFLDEEYVKEYIKEDKFYYGMNYLNWQKKF